MSAAMDVEVPSGPDAHKKDAPPAMSEAKTSSSSGGGAGGQGTESGEGDAKSAGAGAVDAARQKIIENQGLVLRYPRINADFRKKDKASFCSCVQLICL